MCPFSFHDKEKKTKMEQEDEGSPHLVSLRLKAVSVHYCGLRAGKGGLIIKMTTQSFRC